MKLVNNLSEDPPAVTVCKPGFRSYDEELLERNPGGLWNGAEDTLRVRNDRAATSSMPNQYWNHQVMTQVGGGTEGQRLPDRDL